MKIERELLRERALWGEDEESGLNKWKLDFTEGPSRQRKRLLPNTEEFFRNYPYRAEIELLKPNRKYKIPSSIDGKEYTRRFHVKSFLHYAQYWQEYVQTQLDFQHIQMQHQQVIEASTTGLTELDSNTAAALTGSNDTQDIDSMVAFNRNLKSSQSVSLSLLRFTYFIRFLTAFNLLIRLMCLKKQTKIKIVYLLMK